MNLTNNYLSLKKQARDGIKFTKRITKIIIHWIGPYPKQTPEIVRNWWENGSDGKGVRASAHFVVKGDQVLQTLPIDEVGWHSGDNRNYESIGIEVIPMNIQGEFAEDTINTLRDLVEYIRNFYIGAQLERHADGVQKKNCPNWYTWYEEGGDERWIALRNYLDKVGAL